MRVFYAFTIYLFQNLPCHGIVCASDNLGDIMLRAIIFHSQEEEQLHFYKARHTQRQFRFFDLYSYDFINLLTINSRVIPTVSNHLYLIKPKVRFRP